MATDPAPNSPSPPDEQGDVFVALLRANVRGGQLVAAEARKQWKGEPLMVGVPTRTCAILLQALDEEGYEIARKATT